MLRPTHYTWLGLSLLLGTLSGCTMRYQTPSLHTIAADFNMYARPALFYDVRDHHPSLRKHTNFYLWSHGPVVPPRSAMYRHPDPSLEQMMGAEEPAVEMPLPPGPPATEGPMGPAGPGQRPEQFLPPPPSPGLQEEQAPPPRKSGLLAPPAVDASTAQSLPQTGVPTRIRQASWQPRATALPGSSTLFARP